MALMVCFGRGNVTGLNPFLFERVSSVLRKEMSSRVMVQISTGRKPRVWARWIIAKVSDKGLWFCGQVEHLKQGPIKGDQVFSDEGVPGPKVVVYRELEQRTNGVVGVKGKTLAVGDQDQEKVQEQLFLIEGRKKAVGEKTVGDKAEAALNASDSIGVEDLLLDHGWVPRSMMLRCREDPLSVSIAS
jgi:hypothetical protein